MTITFERQREARRYVALDRGRGGELFFSSDSTSARLSPSGQLDLSYGDQPFRYLRGDNIRGQRNTTAQALDHKGRLLSSMAYEVLFDEYPGSAIGVLGPEGGPDRSFASRGVFGARTRSNKRYEYFYDLDVQPDGKILASGWRFVPNPWLPRYRSAFVLRLLPNGRPDRSFGENGRLNLITLRYSKPTFVYKDGVRYTKQKGPKTKLGAAGVHAKSNRVAMVSGFIGGELFAAKVKDGRLDRSYGRRGVARVKVGYQASDCEPIEWCGLSGRITPSGSGVVVSGFTIEKIPVSPNALVRFDRIGRLDRSFGNRGIVRIDRKRFRTAANRSRPEQGAPTYFDLMDVVRSPWGGYLLTGDLGMRYGPTRLDHRAFAVAALNRKGQPARSFADRGAYVLPGDTNSRSTAIATGPGPTIYIAGKVALPYRGSFRDASMIAAIRESGPR